MDVLDYSARIEPDGAVSLSVRLRKDVEPMNHGFYFRGPDGALISVPYRDIAHGLRFTEEGTWHVFLFHKDAALARSVLRKYFRQNGMPDAAGRLKSRTFENLGETEPERPFDREEKEAIRRHDRQAIRDEETEDK